MQIEEYGFPFASVDGDRRSGAEDWAAYFSKLISNGVFPAGTQLQVASQVGMTVRLGAGSIWVGGHARICAPYFDIMLDAADGVLHRIDRIVARLIRAERRIHWLVIKGMLASNPSAPPLVRNADYYDMGLATVAVNAGITAITQAMIADTRLDNNVCGLVSSLIQPDTTGWWAQFDAAFQAALLGNQTAWNAWLESVEGSLAGDPAAQLAAHLVDLDNPHHVTAQQIGAAAADDVAKLQKAEQVFTTAGSVPAFTVADASVEAYTAGLMRTLKFHAAGSNVTININGKGAKTLYQYTGKAASVQAGQVVKVWYDGANFFTRSGGGGIEFPDTPSAGDTPLICLLSNPSFNSSSDKQITVNYKNIPGRAFKIKKAGVYRISYIVGALSNQQYIQLTKNGIAISNSEVNTTSSAVYKTIDVSLAVNDVIRQQVHRVGEASSTYDTYITGALALSITILAADVQTAISDILEPTT